VGFSFVPWTPITGYRVSQGPPRKIDFLTLIFSRESEPALRSSGCLPPLASTSQIAGVAWCTTLATFR